MKLASNCRYPNEYDWVDYCRPWNESQRSVLPSITAMSYSLSKCCQQSSMLQAIGLCFNKRTLHLSVSRTLLNCHSKNCWTSLLLISGHQIAKTWIQWIIRSGVLCSRECMNVEWTVSMSWSSASLKSGTVCSGTLLTWPSTSAESDWEHACVQTDNILNTYWECVWLTKVMDK